MNRTAAVVIAVLLLAAEWLGAQEEQLPQPQVPLLESKGMEIGGTLYSNFTAFVTWADAFPDFGNLRSGASNVFVPDLQADLYFDSRPFSNLRVFTKLRASYPFSSSSSVFVPQTSPLTPFGSAQTGGIPNISVFELFADVTPGDWISIRVGQQVVSWGVGYFFSPADILSLTPIDPLRPELEREGPLALKVDLPFAATDSVDFYVIANQAFSSNGLFALEDLAAAAKIEVLVSAWELGLGAYFQRSQRPKAMMTATGSVFGKLGVFGEAVVSSGADRVFVELDPAVPGSYQTYTDTTTPYFSGTVGLKYVQPDWHVLITGQYYYNGQGYADAGLEQAAFAAYRMQLAGSAPAAGPLLSPTDVFPAGKHYLAGLAKWSDILGSGVALSFFYEGNVSDGSGVISPGIAYTPFEYVTLTIAPYLTYGDVGTELVSYFGKLSLSLMVTIGQGSF